MKKMLLLAFFLPLFTASANDFPNSSFEYDLLPVWNRMPNQSAVLSAEGYGKFSYSSDCASGKRSLRLCGKKAEFDFESSAKLKKGACIFALKMKAPKNAIVKISCHLHLNTERTVLVEKSFKVTPAWKNYALVIGNPFTKARRGGSIAGPLRITIDPGKSELLVDDCSFTGHRKAPVHTPGPVAGVKEKEMPLPAYLPLPSAKDFGKGPCRKGEWTFKLFPAQTGAEKEVSLSGVMLFPKSEVFFNSGSFALYDGKKELSSSFYPIAAWPGDNSLAALKVDFTADTAPAVKDLKLRFTPGKKRSPAVSLPAFTDQNRKIDISRPNIWLQNGIFGAASLAGVDYTGRHYIFRARSKHMENGTLLLRGKLLSSDGLALGTAEVRMKFRKNSETELDIAFSNTSKQNILIKELYWQSQAPGVKENIRRTIWGDHQKKHFTVTTSRNGKSISQHLTGGPDSLSTLPLSSSGISLHVYNGVQTFPNALEISNGTVKGSLWPASAKVLSFAPGMTLRKRFLLSPAVIGRSPDHAPAVMPSAADFARSGVMISMCAYSPERFPFFESRIKGKLERLAPDDIHRRFCYGQFNYGDHPGDGGWANLESFEDYVLYHRAMREADPKLFRLAQTASRHYGDIDADIRTALPHTHSANHIIGGNGFGHAWIPGIMSAWLLTGDPAFYQTARRMLNACIALPLTSGEIQQGRNFGFYLLTLAEGYAIFNDPAAFKRYMAQLDYQIKRYAENPPTEAEKRLQRTSIPRQNSLFYVTSSGLVPFHCWYGLTAFLKMYELTGDPLIRKTAEKEFANIMNLEMTFRPQIETHWPGLPAEQLLPTIATDYLFGRGAFYYPVLAMYARMSGKKEILDLAADTLYCGLLAARGAGNIQDVFMAAPLAQLPKDFDEAGQIAKIRRLLQNGAAPELANGDFSQSILYSDLVIPKKGIGTPRYPAWALKKPYPRFWHFVEGKQIISSMFMTFRGEYYTLDNKEFGKKAPSLRLDMTDRRYFAGGTLTSAKFRMAPGQWRFNVSFKNPGNVEIKRVGMRIMTFGGNPPHISVTITPDGKVVKDEKSDPAVKLSDISYKETGKAGWKRLSFTFRIPSESLGVFRMQYNKLPRTSKAHLYVDDVEIKRIGN